MSATRSLSASQYAHIANYIGSEFSRWYSDLRIENGKLRGQYVYDCLEGDLRASFLAKHQSLKIWMDENPNYLLQVCDRYYRLPIWEQIAQIESEKKYPFIKDVPQLDSKGVVAYLSYKMPKTREVAIQLVLEKCYSNYPDFCSSLNI